MCMKTIYPSPLKAFKALTLALTALLLTAGAEAQTAANWNFNTTLAATTGSNITAPNVSLGSSIVSNAFNGGGEFYGQDGWPTSAIDPNAYLQFSVSPNTGYYLVLNTVTMIIRRSNTGTPQGAGPNNWTLRSSLDGYSTDIASNSMTYNYATFTVTLPTAFQTLGSAVTFRLYGFNTTINSGGNSRFVTDNISIQGQAISGVLAAQSLELTAKANTSGNAGTNAGANTISLQYRAQGFEAGTTYSIERSVDGTNFTAIERLISNTAETSFFQYTDGSIPAAARVFYRVSAQQPDGTSLRSAITVVSLQQTAGTSIRSVAVSGSTVRTALYIGVAGSYQLNVWSQDGRALYRQVMNEQAGDQVADISLGNYPHGLYVLTVSKDGVNTSRQFVY
jgi:hypothetical protein